MTRYQLVCCYPSADLLHSHIFILWLRERRRVRGRGRTLLLSWWWCGDVKISTDVSCWCALKYSLCSSEGVIHTVLKTVCYRWSRLTLRTKISLILHKPLHWPYMSRLYLFNLTFCLFSFLSGYKCLWKHVYRDTVSREHAATGAGMRSLLCTLIGCRKESDFCTQSPYLFDSVPVPDTALTNVGLQTRDRGLCECKNEMVQTNV